MHGKGTLKGGNGKAYDGEWKDNNKHGIGTFTWENGDVYTGEFVEGMKHGWGTLTFASGHEYEGHWVEGKQHGKGTMKFSSGDIYQGIWADGNFVRGSGVKARGWTNGMPTGIKKEEDSANAKVGSEGAASGASKGGQSVEEKRVHVHERTVRSQRSQQRRLERTAATKSCEHCGVDDHQYKLRKCSTCGLALYCSVACQKAARGSHRRICNIISELPPKDSDKLLLRFKEKRNDFDAGLRYATKYMDHLKHLEINVKEMVEGDTAQISPKRFSSLLRSKKGALDSLSLVSGDRFSFGFKTIVWEELRGLKQLRLCFMQCIEVQSIQSIILQQRDTLMVLCLPWLRIDWSKAKFRRTLAQAVNSCKHLVRLELEGCVLMDSDLKVMLQDLPNLRNLNLGRDRRNNHEFTDNTCGLLARKCPCLQELNLDFHNHLSVRGIRKIFGGCAHLRMFYTTTCKLKPDDVRSLLDIAPQLLIISLNEALDITQKERDEIVEATGGRTLIQFSDGVNYSRYESNMRLSAEARKNCQAELCKEIQTKSEDPINEWEDLFEG